MPGWRRVVPVLWSVLLAALALGPALGPGYVLSYDMVWVPDLALRPDVLGVGSGLPRAVPSDAVVAVLDEIVPGMLLQKLVLLGALAGGGLGILRLAPRKSLTGQLVAVSVYQWNPFVAERLVLGHWPLLVGYAVLPWLVLAAREWRTTGVLPWRLCWLVPLGSLSASAGLATGVVLVAFAAERRVRRWAATLALLAVGNAPWLVSGLLHAADATTDPAGASAFALHSEGVCRRLSQPSASVASGMPRWSRLRVTACWAGSQYWPCSALRPPDCVVCAPTWAAVTSSPSSGASSLPGWRRCSPGRCRRR